MVDDDDAVAREPDIELEAIGPERESVIEGEDRVLRPQLRPAPMRKNQWHVRIVRVIREVRVRRNLENP
jgi:hypothetical protein